MLGTGTNNVTETGFSYVKFPQIDSTILDQDEEWITIGLKQHDGKIQEQNIRFHDYHDIYKIKGLYEYIFAEHLKCNSPDIIAKFLSNVVATNVFDTQKPFRLLDVGAGGGMVAEALKKQILVEACFGLDILPEARLAALRDRPGLYNEYLAADLTKLTTQQNQKVSTFKPNLLSCVSALGFGDIPVEAFRIAFNAIENGGAIAFTAKDSFLQDDDTSGFAAFIRKMTESGSLEIIDKKRFFHRLSVNGDKLYYEGVIGKKHASI